MRVSVTNLVHGQTVIAITVNPPQKVSRFPVEFKNGPAAITCDNKTDASGVSSNKLEAPVDDEGRLDPFSLGPVTATESLR